MKLILDTENSHPTTITVRGKEMTLLLIESSILIDSSQIAKIFDKKEKTVATKVQKSKLDKYETENIKLLKNYGLMNLNAVKPRPFYDLRQMLDGPENTTSNKLMNLILSMLLSELQLASIVNGFIIVALTNIK